MLVLEHAGEALAHGLAADTAFDLAVEHVNEGVRGLLAQVEGLKRHGHLGRHTPSTSVRRFPGQTIAVDGRGEVAAVRVIGDAVGEGIGARGDELALRQGDLGGCAVSNVLRQKRHAMRARVLHVGGGLLEPTVVAVSHLIVGPEPHAQAGAFAGRVSQQLPVLLREGLRVAATGRPLNGADGFDAFRGEHLELSRDAFLRDRLALPPPQGHFAPFGVVGRFEAGAQFGVVRCGLGARGGETELRYKW